MKAINKSANIEKGVKANLKRSSELCPTKLFYFMKIIDFVCHEAVADEL